MPEFIFDGSDMDAVMRDLRESALRVDAEVEKTVLEVGEEVKAAAKKIAGEHSSKIPPTIHADAIPHGVAVRAGSANVPLAALYDLGNQGKGGRKADTFSHPVFGDRETWVKQKRFPFFAPARKLLRAAITERMGKTWDEALKPLSRR